LLVVPALLYKAFKFTRIALVPTLNTTTDIRAYYPTYSDKNTSIKLLNEFAKLKTKYRDFISWRREPVSYEYTNIGSRYHTRRSANEGLSNANWFFGGSTMWGTGASDLETIPSYYAKGTGEVVTNFGETGWNSRQSLNYLTNIIGDNHRPKRVIFYDGVNDVAHQCRSEIKNIPSTSRENELQALLSEKDESSAIKVANAFRNFITAPYKRILPKAFSSASSNTPNLYDCDSNKDKSNRIAEHLVNNWYSAYLLTSSHGGRFYAVLQPTLFSSISNDHYLPKGEWDLARQYQSVYPLVISQINARCKSDAGFCRSFINGSNWINTRQSVFIDFCHLSPAGNKIVAENLIASTKE